MGPAACHVRALTFAPPSPSRLPKLTRYLAWPPPHPNRIGAPVALFSPRVPTHVVAVLLPEARVIFLEQLDAGYPLGALPQIQVRNQEPYRPAVFGRERLAAYPV